MTKKRVLVGMSGGIDSTATCILLQEQGYEVIGVTIRTWDSPVKFSDPAQELPDYIQEAKTLAGKLSIEHYIADERIRFKELVVNSFIEEYLKGYTPNPCVICNPVLKFKVLMELADKFNCDYIATGHYSRLEKREELVYILVGEDEKKDQSYFLWRLGQDILRRCIFPLGGFTKKQVREYLKSKGFESKSKEGESMEVCFVDKDYREFLRTHVPDIDQKIGKGMYVNSEGVKIGEHRGYPYYTIGQRKGLEIALGYPAYVLKTNPLKNTVMLGTADKLKTNYMLIEDFFPVNIEDFSQSTDLTVRIRYKSLPIPCELKKIDEEKWLVKFKEEASAVAPGQSAVFYAGKRLLGGSFIGSQRGIGMYVQGE